MKKKIALVSGADGFIGSHLVEKLILRNYKVKALCLYNSLNSFGWLDDIPYNLKKKIDIISLDLRDPFFLTENIGRVDYIFNLAALISIPFSVKSPHLVSQNNIAITQNLLELAKKRKIKKFIQMSTSEVYGSGKIFPMSETHPLNPQSPYAASKVATDSLAMSYYYTFDVPVTIVRPFNTFGPRQSQRAVIPTIIIQILQGKKVINLGSLNTYRDFNFVEDTCDAIIKLGESSKTYGETYNIASKYFIQIKQITDLISKIMDKKVKVKTVKERTRKKKYEVNKLLGDNSKMKKVIKWSPKFSGKAKFKAGLDKTIKWYQKKLHLINNKDELFL